jgi:hypothetical protein
MPHTSVNRLVHDHAALKSFVVDVLAHHGWRDVDHRQVVLKECSGFEGRTFHVCAGNCSVSPHPHAVALHVLLPQVAEDDVSKGRMAAAHKLFSEYRIAPGRLAQGCDWFIDPWAGSTIGGVYTLNRPTFQERAKNGVATASPEELGELLAQIHAIPTDWFDEWREQVCIRTPVLRNASSSSHIWPFTARQEFLKDLPAEAIMQWCSASPKPNSFYGARVVTSHADFHPANIVRTSDGLQVLDFGLACVTCAAKDLAWACEYFLCGRNEKRAFASTYLMSSGFPARDDDVDDLLLDAECFALHSFTGPLYGQLDSLRHDPQHGLDEYLKFATIAEDSLTSPALRQEILERGLFFSSRYQALL